MIAVVVVRSGVLPAGYDEAICEAGRRTLLVGSELASTLDDVAVHSTATWTLEVDPSEIATADLARIVAGSLGRIEPGSRDGASSALDEPILLPASPDGRDCAPHLAFVLGRPLFAGSTKVTSSSVTMTRRGGLHLVDVEPTSPFVATLQIGVRGAEPRDEHRHGAHAHVELADIDVASLGVRAHRPDGWQQGRGVESVEIQPPDASTMDLAEAPRILGGGAGLTDSEAFGQLHRIAAALGASMGVTRVVTDRGWVDHTRQIGTTGVVVDPRLYISFGISGAVQHTSGLGQPDHIISVNTDAHCPMMQMSDVAIIADANEVLDALETLVLETTRLETASAAES